MYYKHALDDCDLDNVRGVVLGAFKNDLWSCVEALERMDKEAASESREKTGSSNSYVAARKESGVRDIIVDAMQKSLSVVMGIFTRERVAIDGSSTKKQAGAVGMRQTGNGTLTAANLEAFNALPDAKR